MILTLTINPAIDRTVTVDKLVFEDRGYILDRAEAAGGRGINASQVLSAFGGKTLALLVSGGPAGERMEKSLAGMGFPFEAVRVASESRINLTISDKQGPHGEVERSRRAASGRRKSSPSGIWWRRAWTRPTG